MTEPPIEYLVIEWSGRVVSSDRVESYRVIIRFTIQFSTSRNILTNYFNEW
jgi:hypothetical protein